MLTLRQNLVEFVNSFSRCSTENFKPTSNDRYSYINLRKMKSIYSKLGLLNAFQAKFDLILSCNPQDILSGNQIGISE